jgi:VWFA-related protein
MVAMRLAWPVGLAVLSLGIGFRSTQPTTFARVFSDYRGTAADQAVREFASWSEDRVLEEAQLPADRNDPWSVAALAALHLEAVLARAEVGISAAHIVFHQHLALSLLEQVVSDARNRKDLALLAFCRDWYIVNSTGLRRPRWSIEGFGGDSLEAAERQLADNADIQLLVGTFWSNWMGPSRTGRGAPAEPFSFGPTPGERVISVGDEVYRADAARNAEIAFGRALTIDPRLAEARLRRGRLWQVLGRVAAAEGDLRRASVDALSSQDSDTGYLAELFLGQLYEDQARMAEAIASYSAAVERHPSGFAARLAVAQTLVAVGRAGEGGLSARSAFERDAQPPERDPWSLYPSMNYWRIIRRLKSIRSAVSKTPYSGGAAPILFAALANRETPQPRIDDQLLTSRPGVFVAGVDGVRVEVLVTDGGRPIKGLSAKDFLVSDNGIQQKVDGATDTTQLSVALVMDTSSSMSLQRPWRQSLLAAASVAEAMAPGDRLSVISVSDRLALRADQIQPEASSLVFQALRPDIGSSTAVWDGIFAGAALVSDGPGRGIVAVISDGFDNASWFERRRALALLPRLGLPIEAIGVPYLEPEQRDMAPGAVSLRPAADSTGGVYFEATDPALRQKLAVQFEALRQSYILVYTPVKVPARKDGWHEIKVSLRTGLKGKIQARPGYYGPRK